MLPSGAQAVAEQPQDAPPPPAAAGKPAGGPAKSKKKGGLSREVQVSKALSKLLRHDAEKAGLELDGEGFAGVAEVVSWFFFLLLEVRGRDGGVGGGRTGMEGGAGM